nr:MAG TPA: phosphoprotein [Caudoviricetes sp.]
MNNELLAIGIEELLKRTTEILNNQKLIMDKLDRKKED